MSDLLPFLSVAGMFAAVVAVFYLQVQHGKERTNSLAEVRDVYQTQGAERERFLTEALGSMRAMYNAYMQQALQIATMTKATSAAEGAMAAGTLAQGNAAFDPELQAKLAEIAAKVGNHEPWSRPQPEEPKIPKVPEVFQDKETGEIFTRVV
jgi:hypothetical protein